MENYYLIDYENVHGAGLEGCKKLGKNDHVFIFFTKNAKSLDMTTISELGHMPFDFDTEEVPAGKQSLDMHIASFVGYLVGMHGKDCKVVIVSKDNDYNDIISYWNKQGYKISRSDKIGADKPETKQNPESSKKTKLNQEIMQKIREGGYDATVANKVSHIVSTYYGKEMMYASINADLKAEYTNYQEVFAVIKDLVLKNISASERAKIQFSEKKSAMNKEIQQILSKAGCSAEEISFTASAVVSSLGKENGKQQVHNKLITKFGQEKGADIYNRIKKHF